MLRSSVLFIVLMFASNASSVDVIPNIEFLEWLGQTAEMEELGVDVDKLIDIQQQDDNDSDLNSEESS